MDSKIKGIIIAISIGVLSFFFAFLAPLIFPEWNAIFGLYFTQFLQGILITGGIIVIIAAFVIIGKFAISVLDVTAHHYFNRRSSD